MSDEQGIQGVLASLPDNFRWNLFEHNMAHKETIKKFTHLRQQIELEDERQSVDKSKGTEKVVLHVHSAPPPPPSVRKFVNKKVPSKMNLYEKATKKTMKTKPDKCASKKDKAKMTYHK